MRGLSSRIVAFYGVLLFRRNYVEFTCDIA